jgi:hypothetical protein
VKSNKRKITAFCVRVGKNGMEEIVRKFKWPTHAKGGCTEVDGITKTGEKPRRRVED